MANDLRSYRLKRTLCSLGQVQTVISESPTAAQSDFGGRDFRRLSPISGSDHAIEKMVILCVFVLERRDRREMKAHERGMVCERVALI